MEERKLPSFLKVRLDVVYKPSESIHIILEYFSLGLLHLLDHQIKSLSHDGLYLDLGWTNKFT